MFSASKKQGLKKLAILLFGSLVAFLPFLPAQQISLDFQRLDRDKGLSQGTCPFISRDSRGFVWVATTDGLNRFDGQNVKVYRSNPSKPHSMVGNIVTSACFEDQKSGDLWFTTYNAVHRYVRAYDHFDTFQLRDPSGHRLSEDYYAFHLDSTGRLWLRVGIGEQGYLHWFDTKTGRDSIVCQMSGNRSAVILDPSGEISQVICTEFDTTGLEIIDLKRGCTERTFLDRGSTASRVHEVFVENDTLVWLGLRNGIAAFNPKTGRSVVYDTFEGQAAGDVWSVYAYKTNLLFVATEKSGLWLFDRVLRRFTQRFVHEADNPFSLMDNETKNLLVDRQDNLWVSHWKYGFSHVNLRKNKFFIPPSAKGNTFWRFHKGPDGNIWCSEPDKGLFVYAPNGHLIDTIDTYFKAVGKRLKFTSKLYFPNDGDWGFSGKYLFKWNRGTRKLELVQELSQRIVDICSISSENTLILTREGVFQLDYMGEGKYHFVSIPFAKGDPPTNLIAIFADHQAHIYLAENYERLLIFKRSSDQLDFIKSIDGLGDCTGFFEKPDGKGVWVACNAGLLNIQANLEARLFTETSDGLPNATYYDVIPDQRGNLWLSSNQGLLRYDTAQRSVHRYLPMDGLFGSEFNEGAFYLAADGKIWAGGLGGLVIFHPDSIRNLPFEPQVQITRIFANDEPYKTAKQAEVLESIDLPYAQNTLSFEFVALEFSNPSANQFQYRLVGYDDKWVKSGKLGFARYANLPPGQYTLEILAANSDGVWSKTPKTLKVNIQTPFYKTWWFYLLCTLSLGGIIYGWLWYRLQQALKIERMRVQISSDLHDDVGTLLAGLAMQSEALELTAPEKDKSKLKRISEISRNAMAHMRDTVWAIDARKDKLENLLDRMREHAEETLTPRDIRFDIQVDNLSMKQNLSTNIRQNVYLLYKEAITNAAKHTNGDMVTVRLKKTGEGFEMRICDNGNVAEKAYKTTGLGTSNMQMRAEKIGGKLEITRKDGFCVVLRLGGLG